MITCTDHRKFTLQSLTADSLVTNTVFVRLAVGQALRIVSGLLQRLCILAYSRCKASRHRLTVNSCATYVTSHFLCFWGVVLQPPVPLPLPLIHFDRMHTTECHISSYYSAQRKIYFNLISPKIRG